MSLWVESQVSPPEGNNAVAIALTVGHTTGFGLKVIGEPVAGYPTMMSVILLLGFIVLLQMLQFSLYLLGTAFFEFGLTFERIAGDAFERFKRTWPFATLVAIAWFAIAYAIHHTLMQEKPKLLRALQERFGKSAVRDLKFRHG